MYYFCILYTIILFHLESMNSSRLPEPTRSERNGGSRLPAAPPTATDGSSRSNAAPWSGLPGLTKPRQPELLQRLSVAGTDKDSLPDDNFFEQLMKMQVYYFAYIHPMSIVTANSVRCLVFFGHPRYLYFFGNSCLELRNGTFLENYYAFYGKVTAFT